jgi:tetratricopeptide (TPR) repeat protein
VGAKPSENEPILQTETGMFLLSALQKRPDPSALEAIRQEVDQELERSAHLDREKWLKVSRAAPRERLSAALEEKMERYHALLDAVGDNEELRTDIELILGRASSLLRIAKQEAKRAATQPGTQASPVLGAAPPASPPDAPAAGPLVAAEPPPSAQASAAAAAAQGGKDAKDKDMLAQQANYLLMEAELRMTVADYANAVRVYAKLVELAPEIPHFHAKLAIAMTCYPRTSKHAEREFLEAIRLDPRNADFHYQLGLYYKSMRLRARAVIEMRAALSLNPHHGGAREELEALAPRDSALKNLKKLFQ